MLISTTSARAWVALLSALLVVLTWPLARAQEQEATGKVLATIPLPWWNTVVTMSEDRRLIFYAGWLRTSHGEDTRLLALDVSDPGHMLVRSETRLGNISVREAAVRGNRLFLLANIDGVKNPSRLLIFDIRNPAAPKQNEEVAFGDYARGLKVGSDDTRVTVTVRSRPEEGLGSRLVTVDLTDATRPVFHGGPIIPSDSDDAACPSCPHAPSPEISGRVMDRWRDHLLVWDFPNLIIWDLSNRSKPRIERTIDPGMSTLVDDARLLPGRDAIILLATRDARLPYQLFAISTARRPFSVTELRDTHARLLLRYANARKSWQADVAKHAVAALDDADVRRLLDDPAGLWPSERVLMLNDYGFWLTQSDMLDDAITVLTQVVRLAPTRAVAWLNLGDAFRAALRRSVDWQAKLSYSRQAADAYRRYVDNGGKSTAVDDFMALNPANAPGTVCDYVAAFYSRGRQAEMFGLPDPVDIAGNGRMLHVYVEYLRVAGGLLRIVASDKEPDPFGALPRTSVVGFGGADQDKMWFGGIHVIPFRKTYYVVYELDDGPYAVVKPNAGRVCTFHRKVEASLTVNRLPDACQRLLSGRPFDPVLPATANGPVDVTLVDGSAARFGREKTVPSDGGCEGERIALIAGNTFYWSPRGRALDDAQSQVPYYCRASASSLVKVGSEVMMQTNRGAAYEQPRAPYALFRILKDRIEEMCRVSDVVHYIPQTTAP
jgi:hypothetical protein